MHWLAFLVCGGYGWYANIVAIGWLDKCLPGWLGFGLFLAAIWGGLWSANYVGIELEKKSDQWADGKWKHLHFYQRVRKQKQVAKWVLAPLILWISPLLLGVFALLGDSYY